MKLERLESAHTQNARLSAHMRTYVREGKTTETPKKVSEKWIEKKLRDEVKKLGGLALKFWPVSFTGFPDRMILMPPGKVRFVELKSSGKDLKPKQKLVRKILLKLGFEVYTIDTKQLLDDFLKKIEHEI